MKTHELSRTEIEKEAERLNLSICKKYDYTIERMIELQKTMSDQEEGFVVLFENGLRVKIKSDAYIRMAKILNSVSPLAIWEIFSDFHVPYEYLNQLPEEVRKEAEEIAKKIYQKMDLAMFELKAFMMNQIPEVDKTKADWRKELGLWLKVATLDSIMKKMVFPYILGDNDCIFKHIKNKARPTGNHLDE
jgi:RNA ligase